MQVGEGKNVIQRRHRRIGPFQGAQFVQSLGVFAALQLGQNGAEPPCLVRCGELDLDADRTRPGGEPANPADKQREGDRRRASEPPVTVPGRSLGFALFDQTHLRCARRRDTAPSPAIIIALRRPRRRQSGSYFGLVHQTEKKQMRGCAPSAAL